MKSLCRCCSSVRKNLVPSMQTHIFGEILSNFIAQSKIYHRYDLCTWFESIVKQAKNEAQCCESCHSLQQHISISTFCCKNKDTFNSNYLGLKLRIYFLKVFFNFNGFHLNHLLVLWHLMKIKDDMYQLISGCNCRQILECCKTVRFMT